MSDWSIQVPFAERSDPLPAVADAARGLPDSDDRAVARQIVLRGMTSGMATAGDLLDELAAMSSSERRTVLDQARADAGLPSTGEADRWKARTATARMIGGLQRDEAGCAIQACPDCGAFPRNPATNEPVPVNAKRWWCPEHEAGHEDDMQPWTPRIVFGPSGAIVFLDEVEREAEIAEREAQRRALQLAQRRAARVAQWPAAAAEDAAKARAMLGHNLKGAQP